MHPAASAASVLCPPKAEVSELVRQRDALAEQLGGIQEQHAAALQPLLDGLAAELAALRADADAQRAKAAAAQQEVEAQRGQMEQVGCMLCQYTHSHCMWHQTR